MLRAPNLALSNSPNWLQLVSIILQSPLVPHLLNTNHFLGLGLHPHQRLPHAHLRLLQPRAHRILLHRLAVPLQPPGQPSRRLHCHNLRLLHHDRSGPNRQTGVLAVREREPRIKCYVCKACAGGRESASGERGRQCGEEDVCAEGGYEEGK
jgi:hypothetical protein